MTDDFNGEADLQHYLEQHWDETSLGKDWKLYGRGHVNAGKAGIIDLLAGQVLSVLQNASLQLEVQ